MQQTPNDKRLSVCTFYDMNDEVESRLSRIAEELANGFNLIKSYDKSVTFFGSARFEESNPHYQVARRLAKRIGDELGYAIVSGGGPGIMEAANRGAYEAGVDSIGFTIMLPHEQVTNKFVVKQADFDYFFSRKLCMTYATEAYVYFAGGFGTLDEFFEILTLVQVGKIESVPIILVGSSYWKPIVDPIIATCLKEGTISENEARLFIITDNEDEVLRLVMEAPLRTAGAMADIVETPASIDGVTR